MNFEYRHKLPSKPSGEKAPLLLLLHGFGADENDLFGLASFLDERFFVASARAPYSLPYGGFAWFELYIQPGRVDMNIDQFKESLGQLEEFIGQIVEKHDLDAQRIYLCGFSQGSIMSLTAALSDPGRFAGLVCMSGRSSPEMLPAENDPEKLKDFPVLVTHGVYDQVLPVENGRATNEFLSKLPVDLEYKEYPIAHEISQQSLTDVTKWLTQRLDN
ncbi:MAG: alpha/beta fold hydrolase [Pyrinomonadaceae bacterium]